MPISDGLATLDRIDYPDEAEHGEKDGRDDRQEEVVARHFRCVVDLDRVL